MSISIPRPKTQFYLTWLLLIVCIQGARSQSINNKRGIETEFTSKKTIQAANDLASNVLKIRNNSGNSYTFSIDVSTPDGWKLISRKTNSYTVAPYDSVFVPVNLIAKNAGKGNVNHLINASLINEEGTQFASAVWYLNVKKESNWHASPILNKVFFLDGSNTVQFGIKLQNSGNSEEKIKIQLASDRRLRILQNKKEIRFYNITLPVDTDTIIYFTAEKLSGAETKFRNDYFTESGDIKAEILKLRINIESEPDGYSRAKTWRGAIEFIKAGTEAKLKERSYAGLPLTIEAMVENVLSNSTVLNLNLYGNTSFDGNRSLVYQAQTYFSNNFYNYSPYLGNSHYVGYTTPKTRVEIGDVSGNTNFGFTSTGRGIKAKHEVFKGNSLGAFYLQSPRLLGDVSKTDYGVSHQLTLGRSSIDNYLQFTDNELLKFTGSQYSNRIQLGLGRFHRLTLSSAFTRENYNNSSQPVTRTGFAYQANYIGIFKKLSLNLTNSFGSEFNTSYRGIRSSGIRLGYTLSSRTNIEGSYYIHKQKPSYLTSNGFLLNTRPNEREHYGLKYNFNRSNYSGTLALEHRFSDAFNLRIVSDGGGVDLRPKQVGDLRFYLSLYGYYNTLLDYDLGTYFTSQFRSTIRYKGLTSSIRYNYGPYQAFQQLLFATTGMNSQSIFTNTNVRLWLIKSKVSFEPSFVYSHETMFKRSRVSIRPELYYITRNSLELRFYSQFINNSQKENPYINPDNFRDVEQSISSSNLFVGFGIKKNLAIPISRKKYHDLKVSVFKDLNGNNKQDKNEVGLKDVLVNIKSLSVDSLKDGASVLKETGESFVTNEEGKIVYKNLPKGTYKVSLVPLVEQAGFFAGNGEIVSLTGDQTVATPLNEGGRLTGILVAQRDQVAADFDRKIDLSKIRVTAIDSLGRIHSTLTDHEGRFTLRLPVGVYTVSINESILPDNFELQQKNLVIEMLTASDSYNVTFNILEKKRKLNIKRFDQQGKVIENNNNRIKLKNENE